jgi:hypothetical protein
MARYVIIPGVAVWRLGTAAGVCRHTAVMGRNPDENEYVHDGKGT